MREHCYACGKPEAGSRYCGYCGIEQSEYAQRQWAVERRYEAAAREAVVKAERDRELYDEFLVSVTLDFLVRAAAKHTARERNGESGELWLDRVQRFAVERLKRRD